MTARRGYRHRRLRRRAVTGWIPDWPESDPWVEEDCGRCWTCLTLAGWPESGGWPRMVVCPECGNKRCPHATWHGEACTGSNAPGQEGSRY